MGSENLGENQAITGSTRLDRKKSAMSYMTTSTDNQEVIRHESPTKSSIQKQRSPSN